MAEKWTNTSADPSSGAMKPYPLSALNDLTVPSAMYFSCRDDHSGCTCVHPWVFRDRQPAGKTWPCTRGARCTKFAGAGTHDEFRLQPPPIKHHAGHPASAHGATCG